MKTVLALVVMAFALVGSATSGTAADAPKAATPADVSGTWDAVVETPQGSGTPVFVLNVSGDKVTGQYKGQFGSAPLTGALKGDRISFSFRLGGQDVKVEYAGVVTGDTMKGTAKFGTEGEGTFSAKKRAGK